MKKRGNKLHPDDKAHVLRTYVYRNTLENPFRLEGGSSLSPPITDQKWLEITDFAVRDNGRLNRRVKECHTNHDEVPEWQAQIEQWARNRDATA